MTHKALPVTVPPVGAAGLRLAAYVQLSGLGAAPSPEGLRRWCSERLPAAAVPAAVAVLPQLPRSAAGKLARGALPQSAWSDPGSQAGSGSGRQGAQSGREVAGEDGQERRGDDGRAGLSQPAAGGGWEVPRAGPGAAAGGGWEARTLGAFARALGLPRLEPAADFFEAGGDSLAAAAVAAALGIDVRQVSASPLQLTRSGVTLGCRLSAFSVLSKAKWMPHTVSNMCPEATLLGGRT